jgi:hypothetical protein
MDYGLLIKPSSYGFCERPVQFFEGEKKVVAYAHNLAPDLRRRTNSHRRQFSGGTIYLYTLLRSNGATSG